MLIAALESASIFVDCSGASALVRVGRHLFACSFTNRTSVRLVQNRAQSNIAPKGAWRAAEALFAAEIVAHFTPDYLTRNAALYAAPETT